MNKAFFVGNLTRDPESKTTNSGITLCTFTIAVNRRGSEQEADFVRVTVWRQLAQNCLLYLAKGKKVAVTGSITANAYMGNDGKPRASLELNADDVEFLSPRGEVLREAAYLKEEREAIQNEPEQGSMLKQNTGFVEVDLGDDLPF